MSETRFRVHPAIAHENLDGEVLAIDLAAGVYFSLKGSAAEVFSLLAAGLTAGEAVARLQSRWTAADGVLASDVAALLARALEEKLLVADAARVPADCSFEERPAVPWEAPELRRYTDMQDLLTLDPIHDVDAAGWPEPG